MGLCCRWACFFFQAEDGIRDADVTGVQTCALPISDDYVEKILEVARWAMSGANSQPWEFIVVRDPEIKRQLRDAYSEHNTDYIFWMEQQREYKLRHPSYQVKEKLHESLAFNKKKANWHLAPAIIVVLGDGRRQWGTVMGAPTFVRDQSHLTDGLPYASFLIHLAVPPFD